MHALALKAAEASSASASKGLCDSLVQALARHQQFELLDPVVKRMAASNDLTVGTINGVLEGVTPASCRLCPEPALGR